MHDRELAASRFAAPAQAILAGLESRRFVVVALVVGLGLRIGWLLVFQPVPRSDFGWYWERAGELAAGEGYVWNGAPTAFWPVGYPAFLAVIRLASDGGPAGAGLLQCGLALVAAWLVLDCTRLTLGEAPARIALMLFAVHPSLVAWPSLLAAESLLMPLHLAAARLLLRGRTLTWLPAGAITGVVTLVKPQYALVMPALILTVAGARRQLVRGAGTSLLVAVVAGLVVAPWTCRNASHYGRIVVVSTNGGVNLLIGNHAESTGTCVASPVVLEAMAMPDEGDRDGWARARATDWMREQPWSALRLVPRKLRWLYADDDDAFHFTAVGLDEDARCRRLALKALARLNRAWYLLLLLAAASWVVVTLLGRTPAGPWLAGLAVIACITAIHVVYFGSARFHAPLMPWILAYSGAAASSVLASTARRGSASARPITPGAHGAEQGGKAPCRGLGDASCAGGAGRARVPVPSTPVPSRPRSSPSRRGRRASCRSRPHPRTSCP